MTSKRSPKSADYFNRTHNYTSGRPLWDERPKLYRSYATVGAGLRRTNAVVGNEHCGGVQGRDGEELT